ncbi:pyridoxal kinase [Rhodospirillum rubrum]|uniref:pyridoxal kinase n=1 Tax=Rhodospirillum rubrum (strain ATCC 11170 / ATH 1.1.1 / DSM 467 / LMG 4362 / NCIMB 8255 / S1) TaxID=269796 RepID=Q2RV45_RHORT|nr:pyridoxal kinase [Rhodospirillum rubrum]ABC22000.1 Pyridoxal kinase [Rhodospirillum rubrum ATCC 11170]AEO47712.1 pyridoxal kinase [Rhodospirillum rubrum F11]MBK5953581.1 pyridoxal kinase [Rhodospirillum rubrum]QXG81656.1 pyridoxal kinase [Rhodospirillum rubrum]HAP99155.1 pyridoxal kinase [Rhodospirillum rubrum]
MPVLSIQSHVCAGHVGNAAAVPALQALGREPIALNTVAFAHHPGRGRPAGRVTPAEELATLLAALRPLDEFRRCKALLSGYLGRPDTAEVVAEAIDSLRAITPRALVVCDPVLGDTDKGLYVDPALPGRVGALLVPRADILMPNAFELAILSGRAPPLADLGAILEAARALVGQGPRAVIVTSLPFEDGGIGDLLVTATASWLARGPLIAGVAGIKGTGDLLSALLVGHLLRDAGDPWHPQALPRALALAVAGVRLVLGATAGSGRGEMALVRCLPALASPLDPVPIAPLA